MSLLCPLFCSLLFVFVVLIKLSANQENGKQIRC